MNRRLLGALMAFLLLLPLLVASCSDDDDNGPPTGPGEEVEVPEIPQAEINTQVDFQSQDQTAQQAQAMVQGQLAAAQGLTAISSGLLNPLEQAQWTEAGEDCARWSYTQEGCTATYEVCETQTGYEWTFTLHGTCIEGQSPLDNWVAWRGTTNADGTSGTFVWYELNSTAVGGAWTWSYNPTENSGNWSFYEGEIDPGNLIATMDWMQSADGTQTIVWTIPGESKWETTVSANGRVGTMEFYDWVVLGQTWRLQMEIDWDNGSGSWTTYDNQGEVIDTQTW